MHFQQVAWLLFSGLHLAAGAPHDRRGTEPTLPHDDKTTKACTWWHDNKAASSCQDILDLNHIDLKQFRRWNPSIGQNCQLTVGRSYCVEAMFETGVEPAPQPTKVPEPSPTKPSNGITTPSPIQADVAKNCNKFHVVKSTTTCESIRDYYNLPLKDFYSWNPSVGDNCQWLLVGYNVCVSIVGWKPPTPSPTTPSNGIKTPSPLQTGITKNCNKFALVKSTTTCDSIQNYYKITMAQIFKWNPAVGSGCTGLWVGYNVCVGVIGQTTPTQPPKTDPTPSPIQAGTVKNCKKFAMVKSTTTCASIQNYYKITMAQIFKWNPAVGSGCTGLWVGYNVCVSA